MINSILAFGFDESEINWSDLTPVLIEYKTSASTTDIQQAIDTNVSLVGIYASSEIVPASGLIGSFLSIDAASLLGRSKANQDQQWIKDVATLRNLLIVARAIKSDTQAVITQTLGASAFKLFGALNSFAQNQVQTILVGPGAIALGYVAIKSDSKLKDYLLTTNTASVPAINEAIKFMGCKEISIPKENLQPLAELALAVTILKASEL